MVSIFNIFQLETPNEIFLRSLEADSQWRPFSLRIFYDLIIPNLNQESTNLKDLLFEYNIEDVHWTWNSKSNQCSSEFIWLICIIDSTIEGIIIIKHPFRSFIYEHDIFYIDYLASAPWNRNSKINVPIYNGVGRLIIKAALKVFNESFKYPPGFNLHSLKRAESYYRKLGMEELDLDPQKQNLRKFEMKDEGCKKFLLNLDKQK